MQIFEDKRCTSPSRVNFGLARSARFSSGFAVSGVAVGASLRAKRRLVSDARKLKSVLEIAAASRTTNCTVLRGLVGMPLTSGAGFCAVNEVEDAFFVPISVVSVSNTLVLCCFVTTVSPAVRCKFCNPAPICPSPGRKANLLGASCLRRPPSVPWGSGKRLGAWAGDPALRPLRRACMRGGN